MDEFEEQFLTKPIPSIPKDVFDSFLSAHSLGIKHQYYVPPKSYAKKVSSIGLVEAPTGFIKAPDENWSSMRLKEAIERMAKTQQDFASFFEPGEPTREHTREHIMNDDIRFMYPTTILPVESIATLKVDSTIEWKHAEANCFKSDIKMEILKDRSAKPGIMTMMYDFEATADFSKLFIEACEE
ncbi:hypothetical protein D3C75_494300 [compost metagenome]